MSTEPIEIELEPDLPAVPEVEVQLGKEVASDDAAADDLRKQVQDAKDQAAAAIAERRAAEQRATEQAQDAKKARTELEAAKSDVAISQYDVIVNAIEATRTTSKLAKGDYKSAMEAGDYEKAAEAQERLSTAAAEMVQLEGGKRHLEQAAAAEKARPKVEARAEPAGDPVEGYISKFSARSQAFLREHKDYVTDPKLNNRLIAAYHLAMAEDYTPDTDAYFQFLETQMSDKPAIRTEPQQRTTTKMPSAPVTRDAHVSNGNLSGSKVKLSPGEVRAATDGTHVWPTGDKKGQPIGVQEFARRKMQMTNDGYYQNN